MSTYTALIRFAPLTTLERVNNPAWKRAGRTMYDPGALSFTPGKSSCPLIVDHDHDQEIGVVHTITRWEDTDGPWLAAIATIHDRPEWLKKGDTKVSFGYKPAGTSHNVFGCEISRRGLIDEVSVLSPARKPAEPGARVVTLRRDEPAAASPKAKPGVWNHEPAAWETAQLRRQDDKGAREEAELRRRLEADGWQNFEKVLSAYRFELGYDSGLALMGVR